MRRVGGISPAEPRAPVPSWQLPPWAQRGGVRDCVGWDCLGLDGVAVQSCARAVQALAEHSVAPGIPVLPSQRAVLPPLLSRIH